MVFFLGKRHWIVPCMVRVLEGLHKRNEFRICDAVDNQGLNPRIYWVKQNHEGIHLNKQGIVTPRCVAL
jgi:hypothetical protein